MYLLLHVCHLNWHTHACGQVELSYSNGHRTLRQRNHVYTNLPQLQNREAETHQVSSLLCSAAGILWSI